MLFSNCSTQNGTLCWKVFRAWPLPSLINKSFSKTLCAYGKSIYFVLCFRCNKCLNECNYKFITNSSSITNFLLSHFMGTAILFAHYFPALFDYFLMQPLQFNSNKKFNLFFLSLVPIAILMIFCYYNGKLSIAFPLSEMVNSAFLMCYHELFNWNVLFHSLFCFIRLK